MYIVQQKCTLNILFSLLLINIIKYMFDCSCYLLAFWFVSIRNAYRSSDVTDAVRQKTLPGAFEKDHVYRFYFIHHQNIRLNRMGKIIKPDVLNTYSCVAFSWNIIENINRYVLLFVMKHWNVITKNLLFRFIRLKKRYIISLIR